MRRDTLLDFFADFATRDDTFIVHDDGYRTRSVTYRQVATAARSFADHVQTSGVGSGSNIVIWSENSIEWIVALWGTLLAGVVLVPVDYRVSEDYLRRVAAIVGAKAILIGEEVTAPAVAQPAVWRLRDVVQIDPGSRPRGSIPEVDPRGPDAAVTGASLAEILFTSGATAEPKGVTITHKNVLANIAPIEREVKKYLRYERPFHPIRFLNLLPLSHMFGQSMATFIPPMIGGTVVFSHGYNPTEIVRQITSRRISVLVCVPKVLDVLREHVMRVLPETAGPDLAEGKRWWRRWWTYRRAHRLFGWKFWCVICGAAPLEAELEAFWRKLGFLVIQGYGLTETAPIVTLNHPFRASKGTVGTPIGGVEIRIAADGEVLVRGDNVTSGYYGADGTAAKALALDGEGWLHTGDVGELDAAGRLMIKGRKKEMIVTPQGLNVFPEDVERALVAEPGVRDAGVVGVRVDGEERVQAVLVLDAGTEIDAVVRGANARLEDHQRVRRAKAWPGAALPRTEGTGKLKRGELRQWMESDGAATSAAVSDVATIESVVERFAASRALTNETTLEELGLSSLDRVELMMALEEAFHVTLDEASYSSAKTLGDLKTLVEQDAATPAPDAGRPSSTPPASSGDGPIAFPSWNRTPIARFIRRISLPTWILPLGRPFMTITAEGLEHLRDIKGPVIFAANHQSHMDAPAILIALPPRWRYRIAPAMAKEFFAAHFNRRQYGWKAWFTNSLNYYLSCEFFNTFPLPQREAGTRQTLRYIGSIAAGGDSILIFPEGKRTQAGEILPFKPGVGMIASRLDLLVIPVRLEGIDKVLHQKMSWPKHGAVRVAFGAPLRLAGDDYTALAKRVEDAVRAL